MTVTTSAFNLPARLSAKSDPALIGADEAHFSAVAAALQAEIAAASASLEDELRAPGGSGEQALARDLQVHRLTARLRSLRRFTLDICLGRMVRADAAAPLYIGRFGLTDTSGTPLLIDWRSPAAAPFFAATRANPMGLATRRRYRWSRGRVSDYWDEAFTPEGLAASAAVDDESAFIASLGSSRSARMRDVLGTIQSDQDAIIRAGSRGALVVDGGPGTGKTVVALHRAAYLLYSDPRLAQRSGSVLFIGPSHGYLSYVEDVLPGLGEEGVQISTVRDLVAEGGSALSETDPAVAGLKASAALLTAVERAVHAFETPPAEGLLVDTEWAELWLSPAEWAEAFDAAEPGLPHNEAREQVWEALLEILADKLDGVPPAALRRAMSQDEELAGTFNRAWPLLDPVGIVRDLWASSDYLSACAPWLDAEQLQTLRRERTAAWTTSDLPYLDAARQRVGDPDAGRLARRRAAVLAAERAEMDVVIDQLIESDDSELQLMSILRGQDAQNSLVDETALPGTDADVLAGPFAHIIVDEAQELTDAEWRMLLSRCPSRSFTVVGDRAQARHGFTESWQERLNRIGLRTVELATLSVNYRTPEEVMAAAEPVIRAAIPDANVPRSVRRSGLPVRRAARQELDALLDEWLTSHPEGTACVIGTAPPMTGRERVLSLTPELAKGLEFDLVVLIDPDGFGAGIEGAVDRYVAMTRATSQLVILV
ncbi:RNA polymerase recycling motor ATPase HelR [Microterricola viridarii]|uniref:AAA family ATPase n=1 Tax=Microterricola viridarii TaxID=412690 RepID=A0A0X8E1C6_9MICO|nr:RNA polymerase recycling motor ATPase HelR [Microterricola viridarii]AMB58525.1 AAA family ATPase [Microterricola viridarii]